MKRSFYVGAISWTTISLSRSKLQYTRDVMTNLELYLFLMEAEFIGVQQQDSYVHHVNLGSEITLGQ
eukprot:1929628-Ditylum_brightwellii.AAC.1